jgi:Sec-independent protein translocase protein TatA
MENEDYILKSLDEQKNTIEKFNEYLSDLVKEMNSGNYNMPVLNTLCNFIKGYNKRINQVEEDDESEDESESKSESPKLLTSESQSQDESEDEAPVSEKKIHIFQSEPVKTDEITMIYQNLINNNPTMDKIFMKPSYDIQKNIEIFIGKSNKY